jgi:transcriptional antiterminator RfaH
VTWYAAYTQPQKERWARSNLWELGFDVYLPEYLTVRRHARRVENVSRPLFPRYLFVAAPAGTMFKPAQAATARGVVDLVRMGRDAPSVPDRVIDELRAREDENGIIRLGRSHFDKGQHVRVMHGSLCEQVGIFECRDDQQRVVILFDLLGRQVRARVAADAVVPYEV